MSKDYVCVVEEEDWPNILAIWGIKEKPKHIDKYVYMVTLTTRPGSENYVAQCNYIELLLTVPRIGDITTFFAYVEELTKNGQPHWHLAFITNKILCKQYFQTWLKNYGNIDVSKSKKGDIGSVLTYIEKSNNPKILRDFL